MYGRPSAIVIAAALLLPSPAAAADPAPAPKPDQASQPAGQRAATVLATADVKLPILGKNETAPVKPKRNARITTCRCADTGTPQN